MESIRLIWNSALNVFHVLKIALNLKLMLGYFE